MMRANLFNKSVIVTGASKGVGRKMVPLLLHHGSRVMMTARSEPILQDMCDTLDPKGERLRFVAGDISDPGTANRVAQATVDYWGGVDVLINAAGIAARGRFCDTQPKVLKQLMDVNILGPAYMTQACMPHLLASRGSVIFLSSLAGVRGVAGNSLYCASKMPLTALSNVIHDEGLLYDQGIHVGIAYLDVIVNDPGKTVLGPNGKQLVLSDRHESRSLDQDFVADKIIEGILRRKRLIIPGAFAKLFYFLNRYLPFVVFIAIRLFKGRVQKRALQL
jgi:dehydrogenase/reductase SDR family protein 7B